MTENITTAVPSIRETITGKLNSIGLSTSEYGTYSTHINAVVEAMEERETEAKYVLREEILDRVNDRFEGYAPDAEEILDQIGLEARPQPEPEVVAPAAPSEDDRIGRLEKAVDRLTQLAERHLGASL